MNKIILISLLATAVLLPITPTSAEECAIQPSCESLGYTMTAADCTDRYVLKCPFDQNKLYCGADKCYEGQYYSNKARKCICSFPVNDGIKTNYCIIAGSDNPQCPDGIYGDGELPDSCCCMFKHTCASGLVYDPTCKCCNWPS